MESVSCQTLLVLVLVLLASCNGQVFPGMMPGMMGGGMSGGGMMGGGGGSSFGSTYGSSFTNTFSSSSGRTFGSNYGTTFGGGPRGGMMRRAVPGDHTHSMTLDQALLKLNRFTDVACIRLIVCQIGAKASAFRHFGEMVKDYYSASRNTNSLLNNTAEVYRMCQKLPDIQSCRTRMGTTCNLPDPDLLALGRDLVN